jgi:hypothetical protein
MTSYAGHNLQRAWSLDIHDTTMRLDITSCGSPKTTRKLKQRPKNGSGGEEEQCVSRARVLDTLYMYGHLHEPINSLVMFFVSIPIESKIPKDPKSERLNSKRIVASVYTIVQNLIARLRFSISRQVLHFCMWIFVSGNKAN